MRGVALPLTFLHRIYVEKEGRWKEEGQGDSIEYGGIVGEYFFNFIFSVDLKMETCFSAFPPALWKAIS
jgi:hypothetical protein